MHLKNIQSTKFLIFCILLFTLCNDAHASSKVPAILASRSDFISTKLALDSIIDPTTDTAEIRRELDDLTAKARAMLGPHSSDADKLNAVRRVLYKAGPWNENRPFTYNRADPYGKDIRTKLLANYLHTRLGNCISMPTLFLIIGDRLGLNVSFALAPLHVFIRYTLSDGHHHIDFETTDFGNAVFPSFYRDKLPISDRAVQSGLYLQALTRQEDRAEMATVVMDWQIAQHQNQDAIETATAILKHFPLDGYTMVKRATAYGNMINIECNGRYLTVMPASVKMRCDMLHQQNIEGFQHAEALGWTAFE